MKNHWRDLSKSIKRFVASINVSSNLVCCIIFKQTFTIKIAVLPLPLPLAKSKQSHKYAFGRMRDSLIARSPWSYSSIVLYLVPLCSAGFSSEPLPLTQSVTILKCCVGIRCAFLSPSVSSPFLYIPTAGRGMALTDWCMALALMWPRSRDISEWAHSLSILFFLPHFLVISLLTPWIHNLPVCRPWKSYSVFQWMHCLYLYLRQMKSWPAHSNLKWFHGDNFA